MSGLPKPTVLFVLMITSLPFFARAGYDIPPLREDYPIKADSQSARPFCDMSFRKQTLEEDRDTYLAWREEFMSKCGLRDTPEPLKTVTSQPVFGGRALDTYGSFSEETREETLTTTATPLTCGIRAQTGSDNTVDNLPVLGGRSLDADGRWPSYVLLFTSPDNTTWGVCGGTLVSEQWVLTSAACVEGQQLQLHLGIWSRVTGYTMKPKGARMDIPKKWKSQDKGVPIKTKFYTPTKRDKYDLALVKLDKAMKLNNRVNLPCFPRSSNDYFAEGECYFIGLGINGTGSGFSFPDYIKEIKRGHLSYEECMDEFVATATRLDENYQMCVAQPGRVKTADGIGVAHAGACLGDLGGPLMCEYQDHWYLVGVIQSANCKDTTTPDVVSMVRPYISWIQDVLEEDRKNSPNSATAAPDGRK